MTTLQSLVPILTWLPRYERAWLRADVMAGLAVWAMTVPQALAYAGIAGVPPIYGLYTVPFAMLAYAIFGTSRTMCVGPESAIAIISAVTVGGLAVADAGEFVQSTALLSLLVGVLFLISGLLRLGWLANFLAKPVLQGFTQGIALTVIASQLPAVFGIEAEVAETIGGLRNLPELVGLDIDYTGFLLQSWAVLSNLGASHAATALLGLSSLVLLFGFRQFRPFAPASLIAVLLTVGAVSTLGLDGEGVRVIGEVETGMIRIALPSMSPDRIVALLPGAFAIVLLGYSVSLSVAEVGARKTGETIDPNQELVGHGLANLGASLSSGFVVCGSLSRGSVITRAGGKTQVVSLVNAGLVILTLLFALPLFFRLPQATLSAVVIAAMSGLLDFGYLRRLAAVSSGEFAYAMAALFGVLLLGIMPGVALGVVLSLAVLIRRVSRPGTAVLGRRPGTENYRDTAIDPAAEEVPGLLIFRFDAPLIFANADFFAAEVRRLIGEAATPVRAVLIPAQQINDLDSTGADALAKLVDDLAARGIELSVAAAKSSVRQAMRRTGLDQKIGNERFHESIGLGVQAALQFQSQKISKTEEAT